VQPLQIPTLEILFARFGLALFLGFLIGLEREREKIMVYAGMRTFALISLLGAVLAFVSEQITGAWLFVIGFSIVALFGMIAYYRGFETGHTGITTEVVSLLAFMLGAMVYWDMLTLASALTVVVVMILSFKPNLQTFLSSVDREDIRAGLEFAIVWVIVLPILPNRTFGPFDVLNPREAWLMVVFVAALNLASYVLSQLYGAQRSIGLTGVLGGMISSTAVTYEFAHRSKNEDEQQHDRVFALAIAVASTGMFFRVPVLALLINSSLGLKLLYPMMAGAVVCALGVAFLAWRWRRIRTGDEEPRGKAARSPFALRPALQFGVLFAVILWLSKAAQVYLGDTGAYISSVVGGIAGLDAVTLSMAKLAGAGISQSVAIRSVTLGAVANMLFKGGIAIVLGGGAVRRQVMPLFVLASVVSIVVAFLMA
jgi:uncharacterized membrane protein (DUF4010 family)